MVTFVARAFAVLAGIVAAVLVATGGDTNAALKTGQKVGTTTADTGAVVSVVAPDMVSRFFETRKAIEAAATPTPAPTPAAPKP